MGVISRDCIYLVYEYTVNHLRRNGDLMNKICHLSNAHPRYDTRILFRECVSLYENGYDVTFLVNDDLPDEVINGVKLKSTGLNFHSNRAKRMTKGIKTIYKMALVENAIVYHLHDPELLLIARKLKKHGKKVIFDSHENYYEQIKTKEYIPTIIRNAIAKIYYIYETHVCKSIDGVITPATTLGQNIFEHRCKKFALVNNLPRLSEYKEASNHLKPYNERRGICYSGSLTYNRGISFLTEASKKAKIDITLAGRFNPDSYQKEIVEGENKENIRYLGFLSREETYRMYGECAIGMSTLLDVGQYSKGDNLPTKVYEYMAMEMPVILSNFSYYKKIVEKYQFGLTADPADSQDIADKINYLVQHKKEAEDMGKRGKALVNHKFNWMSAERELLKLYQRILINEM